MSPAITNLLLKSLGETLYMLGVSAFIAAVAGIPLGTKDAPGLLQNDLHIPSPLGIQIRRKGEGHHAFMIRLFFATSTLQALRRGDAKGFHPSGSPSVRAPRP